MSKGGLVSKLHAREVGFPWKGYIVLVRRSDCVSARRLITKHVGGALCLEHVNHDDKLVSEPNSVIK